MGNNSRTSNWVFQNSANSLGDGNILLVGAGMMTTTIEITGSGTNEVTFEGKSSDDSAFYQIAGVNLTDFSTATKTTSKGVVYQFSLEGLTAFKVRVSQYTNGSVTAKGTVTN